MRALVQRVLSASVEIGGRETAAIGRGALVLLGYAEFVRLLRGLGRDVQTGVFRESMQIRSIDDGPVTILVETPPAD